MDPGAFAIPTVDACFWLGVEMHAASCGSCNGARAIRIMVGLYVRIPGLARLGRVHAILRKLFT